MASACSAPLDLNADSHSALLRGDVDFNGSGLYRVSSSCRTNALAEPRTQSRLTIFPDELLPSPGGPRGSGRSHGRRKAGRSVSLGRVRRGCAAVTVPGGLDEKDRRPRAAQHGFRHGASDRSLETASPMCGHDDEVGTSQTCSVDDRLGGGAIPHGSYDPSETLLREPGGDGGKIRLGLAYDGSLSVDRIHARPRRRMGGAHENQGRAGAAQKLDRFRQSHFGEG